MIYIIMITIGLGVYIIGHWGSFLRDIVVIHHMIRIFLSLNLSLPQQIVSFLIVSLTSLLGFSSKASTCTLKFYLYSLSRCECLVFLQSIGRETLLLPLNMHYNFVTLALNMVNLDSTTYFMHIRQNLWIKCEEKPSFRSSSI